ncbi:MAG: hypothetical protein ACAH21_08220 [Ramlibacter sp.]
MRVVFGVLSLLFVVAVIGFLAKKQLSSVAAPPAVNAPPGTMAAPTGTPKQQVEQFGKAVEGAMQQPRPMPDDQK